MWTHHTSSGSPVSVTQRPLIFKNLEGSAHMGINLGLIVATLVRATSIITHGVSSFESGLNALGLNDTFQHGVE